MAHFSVVINLTASHCACTWGDSDDNAKRNDFAAQCQPQKWHLFSFESWWCDNGRSAECDEKSGYGFGYGLIRSRVKIKI